MNLFQGSPADIVLILMAMLLLALLVRPFARHCRLPFAALLVLIGFVGSELIVFMGSDTGVRAAMFHDLVFYVFLPVLIFEWRLRSMGRCYAPISALF